MLDVVKVCGPTEPRKILATYDLDMSAAAALVGTRQSPQETRAAKAGDRCAIIHGGGRDCQECGQFNREREETHCGPRKPIETKTFLVHVRQIFAALRGPAVFLLGMMARATLHREAFPSIPCTEGIRRVVERSLGLLESGGHGVPSASCLRYATQFSQSPFVSPAPPLLGPRTCVYSVAKDASPRCPGVSLVFEEEWESRQ